MKYSVIVPIFNAERTLQRCLDSILAGHYPDMELLLINDGSIDGSGKICEMYRDAFPNIRYFDKKNGGVSTARNKGLDEAAGEYIAFVDSDDCVSKDYFLKMDHVLNEAPYDYVRFSYSIKNGIEEKKRSFTPFEAHSREQVMPCIIDAMCRKTINGPVAKTYRREIIEANQIRFPVGVHVGEDRAFNIEYSFYIQSCAVSDIELYTVNTENDDSLSRKRHVNLKQQLETAKEYLLNRLQDAPVSEREKELYRQAMNFDDCRSIYHDAKLLHFDHEGWFERQKRLGGICDEINKRHMRYPKCPYCTLISLPVRLRLTPVIDAVAWKLTH